MLVGPDGAFKGQLERGQHKSIQTDRVVLVPGPDEEVAVVQWIYEQFIGYGKGEAELAAALNARGSRTDLDRPWSRMLVREILTNEKYCGNNLYHRTSFKLKQKHVVNPPERWIRKENAFQPLVTEADFATARQIILQRSHRLTDEEMLDKLKGLWSEKGALTGIIIDESEDAPSSAAYSHRFGSLVRAYRLVGYISESDYQFLEINRRLRVLHKEVIGQVISEIQSTGSWVDRDAESDLLTVNGEFTLSLLMSRCAHTSAGANRWVIRMEPSLRPDFSVAVRMEPDNSTVRDYYILPALDIRPVRLRLAESNGIYLDAYRHDTLASLFELTLRAQIPDVA